MTTPIPSYPPILNSTPRLFAAGVALTIAAAASARAQQSLEQFFQPSLEHAPVSTLEAGVRDGVRGDVDGDGDIDVIASFGNTSTLLLNDGFGVFSAAAASRLPAGPIFDLVLADVNGDGAPDLVTDRAVWRNDGAGNFTFFPPEMMPQAFGPRVFFVALDADGDGDEDILAIDRLGNGIRGGSAFLLRSDGTGRLLGAPAAFGGVDVESYAAAVGDLDGDGDVDIVFGGGGAANRPPRLAENDGSGSFSIQPFSAISETNVFDCAIGDVDGDGDADVVSTRNGETILGTSAIAVARNDGGGQFVDSGPLFVENTTNRTLRLVDVDGDSADELIEAPSNRSIRIVDGLGSANPTSVDVTTPRPAATDWLLVFDIDGDGDEDLISSGGFPSPSPLLDLWIRDQVGGGFVHGSASLLPAAPQNALQIVDIDGDGDLDVLEATLTGLVLALRDADGALARSEIATQPGLSVVHAVDLDGDGDLDIVMGAGRSNFQAQPRILMQDAGTFVDVTATAVPLVSNNATEIHHGDFNADGRVDLLIVGAPTLLLQQQSAAPLRFRQAALTSEDWVSAAVADFDLDSDLDIVLCNGASGGETMQLFENRSSAGAIVIVPRVGMVVGVVPTNCRMLKVEDVDGDGDVDVFVGMERGVQLWTNNGTGQLGIRGVVAPIDAGTRFQGYALADLDGDGDRDIVIAAASQLGQPLFSELQLQRRDSATQFTRVPGILARRRGGNAALSVLDLDGDRDADVVYGRVTLLNRLRHAVPRVVPRSGGLLSYELHVFGGGRVLPLLATGLAATPVPTIAGLLTVDLSRTAILSDRAVGVDGIARIEVVLPNIPGLAGMDLNLQAITWDGAALGLTNTVSQTVIR